MQNNNSEIVMVAISIVLLFILFDLFTKTVLLDFKCSILFWKLIFQYLAVASV